MTAFLAALRTLPDNPILRREWRSLGRELGDWRIWLYLRQPRDARGWALRAVAWCALLPYALCAVLAASHSWLRQYSSLPLQIGVLQFSFVLVGFYLCLMSAGVMASGISRERERETWEALRTTASLSHELLLGLLVGRLVPLLVVFLAVGLVWSYTRSHYAPLLQPYQIVGIAREQIELLTWELLSVAAGSGTLALGTAAWCRKTAMANAAAAGDVLFLISGLIGAGLAFPEIGGDTILPLGSGFAMFAGYLGAYYGLQRESSL